MIKKTRGRPIDNSKINSIIETARTLFAQNGFARTTLDAIAEMSGVTKMTIYNHFKSKEELFGATITNRIKKEFAFDIETLDPRNPSDGLMKIASRFILLIRKEEVLGTYRTMFSSALTHPKLCLEFFEKGPLEVHQQVAKYLQQCSKEGSLKITNIDISTSQFLSLFLGLDHIRCMLGLKKPTKKDDEQLIFKNVDFFIQASRN
jgi:TetR/AcrR family transcriptional regulator, mexJK operon transcriptional repressor